jgi:hypothetical protein
MIKEGFVNILNKDTEIQFEYKDNKNEQFKE